MNLKTMWIPLAFVALTFAATAGAEDPTAVPAANGTPPDLCAELDQFGNPARCVATGPGMATVWDAELCCDANNCIEPSSRGCIRGRESYWCESAEQNADGTLGCVYEVPNYCELYPCNPPSGIALPPAEHAICCYEVGCYDHEGGPCGGNEVWCGKGTCHEDGTVECFDW